MSLSQVPVLADQLRKALTTFAPEGMLIVALEELVVKPISPPRDDL